MLIEVCAGGYELAVIEFLLGMPWLLTAVMVLGLSK